MSTIIRFPSSRTTPARRRKLTEPKTPPSRGALMELDILKWRLDLLWRLDPETLISYLQMVEFTIEAVLNDETGEQVHPDQTAEPLCHDEVTGL